MSELHPFEIGIHVHGVVSRQMPFFMSEMDACYLACAIAEAGDGDYAEVGTAFGGSAAFAVLVKRELVQDGTVFTIDPLPGSNDGPPPSFDGATADVVETHFRNMGVANRVTLIQKLSEPWPLPDRQFACALIDGNHTDGWPKRDWTNLAPRTLHRVVFHDYRTGHGQVDGVVKEVSHEGWKLEYARDGIAILERTT